MNGANTDLKWLPDIELLKRVETPCYIFDPARVVATYEGLKAALGTPLMVSFKANPNIDLFVRCAHAFTDGIELASQGELTLVAGRTPAPKFVNTPAMDLQLMRAAVGARATVVLDNLHQADLAIALAKGGAEFLPVMLRVNAVSLLGANAGRVQADHFGMDMEALKTAAERLARAGLGVKGLHIFAGSYTFDVCASQLCDSAASLVGMINEKLSRPVEFVNLGGGFADDWDAANPKFEQYRKALSAMPAGVTVAHEAGRAIFSRGGVFVAKVLAVKSFADRHTVICDGGLAHCFMLAQTEKVMKRLKKPTVVPMSDGVRVGVDKPVQFVGNSCNRSDVIGDLSEGVLPCPGDLAVFDSCGSYHSYTPKNFLELKSPRQYILS